MIGRDHLTRMAQRAEFIAPACSRAGRWFRGCKFVARYDQGTPRQLSRAELSELYSSDIGITLGAIRPQTYVHDICLTCGKILDRQLLDHTKRAGQ